MTRGLFAEEFVEWRLSRKYKLTIFFFVLCPLSQVCLFFLISRTWRWKTISTFFMEIVFLWNTINKKIIKNVLINIGTSFLFIFCWGPDQRAFVGVMSWGILINFHIDFWSSYKLLPSFKFLSENSFVVSKRIIAIVWVFKMSISMLAMCNVKKKLIMRTKIPHSRA